VGLRVTGLITEINSEELEKYVSFWKGLGVSSGMTACHGRGGNLMSSDIYEPKSFGLESGRCGLFQFHTFVTWEGEVLACCHDLTGATRIANLVYDDAFVIAKRKQRTLRDLMPFSVCGQCDEPLRQAPPPQGAPPEGRKERSSFFPFNQSGKENICQTIMTFYVKHEIDWIPPCPTDGSRAGGAALLSQGIQKQIFTANKVIELFLEMEHVE
jgi:hypothetical protein